jgi:MYXO-CTERM domain-containing protein
MQPLRTLEGIPRVTRNSGGTGPAPPLLLPAVLLAAVLARRRDRVGMNDD